MKPITSFFIASLIIGISAVMLSPTANAITAKDSVHQERKERAKEKKEHRKEVRQDKREAKQDRRQARRQNHKKAVYKHNKRHRSYNHVAVHKRYHTHRVGFRVTVLPRTHISLTIGGGRYYYSSGIYYRSASSGYVVVRAPLGFRIATLPYGYVGFHIGPKRYFYVNQTYYVYEPSTTKYIVVEKPAGADEDDLQRRSETAPEDVGELIVYPADGQTEEQLDRDRYECHRWSVKETGFDPVTAKNSEGKNRYDRAITACLEGRGYSVN